MLHPVNTSAAVWEELARLLAPERRCVAFDYRGHGASAKAGPFEATDYAGSGSGSGSIKSVLSFLERWGQPKPAEMSLAQATVLANRLLMTAAEFDTATGGVHPEKRLFATIKLVARSGIRSISAAGQEQFWKEANP